MTPSRPRPALLLRRARRPARGRVKGLAGASARDREVWKEFHTDRVPMAAESEALWDARVARDGPREERLGAPTQDASFLGPTETQRTATVRRAQGFFRRTVLAAYEGRCCVSDIAIGELLVASHIVPWSESEAERASPANGLCLSRLHDGAFDEGLVTFDEHLRLVLGTRLRDHLTNAVLRDSFERFEGRPLRLPTRCLPDSRFLAYHREHRFAG